MLYEFFLDCFRQSPRNDDLTQFSKHSLFRLYQRSVDEGQNQGVLGVLEPSERSVYLICFAPQVSEDNNAILNFYRVYNSSYILKVLFNIDLREKLSNTDCLA